MTAIDNYRRDGSHAGGWTSATTLKAGAWRLAWDPDYAEPDWPGHTYSPEDDDLPSDYPDPSDSDALVEWGRKHFGP